MRIALVVAALALAIPVALGLRSARLEREAERIVERWAGRDMPAAEQRKADDLLRRAAATTPSTRPELRRAQLALFTGRPQAAAGMFESIVRREPENADAWGLLGQALAGSEEARSRAARARYRALNPPLPE